MHMVVVDWEPAMQMQRRFWTPPTLTGEQDGTRRMTRGKYR
jgi:hypothetical protein